MLRLLIISPNVPFPQSFIRKSSFLLAMKASIQYNDRLDAARARARVRRVVETRKRL